jgi:hypothetical protein
MGRPYKWEGEALSEIACRESLRHASGPAPEMRFVSNWFAVFTTPRHEKRMEQHFGKQNKIEIPVLIA